MPPFFLNDARSRSHHVRSQRRQTDRRLAVERLEDRALPSTAAYLGLDGTTGGNWEGQYGSQGYYVINGGTSLPKYATVKASGQSGVTWAKWSGNNYDPSALQVASNGNRHIAAAWYSKSSFTVNLSLTDGQTHDLELYLWDWASAGRVEQVQISDAQTGTVLTTQTVSSFGSGVYVDFAVSGNVKITFTNQSGPNAVLSGLFLDPPTPLTMVAPPTQTAVVAASSPIALGSFTASAGDNGPWTLDVAWGDGSADTVLSETTTGSLGSAPHTYAGHGPYTVTETLANAAGARATASFLVNVPDVAPTITAPPNQTAVVASSTTIALGSFSQRGNNDSPWTVDVSWGDGSPDTAFVLASAGSLGSQAHTYAGYGTYTVTETVRDKDGAASTSKFTVSVPDVAPTLTAPVAQTATAGAATAITLGSFAQPGNNTAPWAVDVSWGDGSADTTFSASTAGALGAQSHTFAGAGTYTVTVSVADNAGTAGSASFTVVASAANTIPTASAAFLGADTVTGGNWMGTYGSQGYVVVNALTSLLSLVPSGQSSVTWATWSLSNYDASALEVPPLGVSHIAAAWYSPTTFSVALNLADGQAHDLALYLRDWGSAGRVEAVQISDAGTGTVLETYTASSFANGQYLDFAVSGNVVITFTNTAGPNAVLSGLFLDPVGTVAVPPAVTAATPAAGATGVATNTPLSATFNEAVQPGSIQVTLTGPTGAAVPATLAYDPTDRTATLTPGARLANSTTYTATVSGVLDALGHPMTAPMSWSFTTGPAPAVTAQTPAPGATGVSSAAAVAVSFNEPVQPGSVALSLQGPTGAVVPATLTYDATDATFTLTPNAPLAVDSTYTATLAGALDPAGDPLPGAPLSWSFTTSSSTTSSFIATDYNNIPDFGAHPTVASVASGSWFDPATWSTGQVPGAGAIVAIATGTTVTYDAASAVVLGTIVVQPGGTLQFATQINTKVIAANYLVLQGGTLNVGTPANPVAPGVTATILTADQPLDTTFDPEQYGDSLIGLGNVTMYGASKTPFAQLAAVPTAGVTTLRFASPVSGWQVGDRLYLPDTRQLFDSQYGGANYVPQWEYDTIAAIAPDGLSVTLGTPLQYTHQGAVGVNGDLMFLPQVANETRNVVVRSQNQLGNRGAVMFLDRADVNINAVAFLGMGRTVEGAFDNTTFDASGKVTHVGTNQTDRSPINFLNLWGPTSPQANGYQFTFADNVVHCIMEDQDHVWGINVNNASYGLIEGNVLDNWFGAGISLTSANDVHNMIRGNFVTQIEGTGARTQTGLDGIAYWAMNPQNSWVDNVATDINVNGVYSYGFNIDAAYTGTRIVPAYPGADPALPGQSATMVVNAVPLEEFSGNTTYGATPNGLALWWIGTVWDTPQCAAGTVKDFTVWNIRQWGYYGYETNQLVIDHFTAIGDPTILSNVYDDNTAMWFSDYMTRQVTIQNADIENMGTGIFCPLNADVQGATGSGAGIETIKDSYLANVTNIVSAPATCVNGSGDLSPIQIVVDNVRFGHPQVGGRTFTDIAVGNESPPSLGTPNLGLLQVVYVYNYNGIAGDNFAVYPTRRTDVGTSTLALIGGYVVVLPANAQPPTP